jgi:cytidylate kinase
MAVITISHQLGSCGREIGKALAQKLGLDYIDQEIVKVVAERLGISEDTATRMDEKTQSTAMRIISSLGLGSPLMIVPPDLPVETSVDEREYLEATQKVIEAAARSNRAVIAGHGANFALSKVPGVLNVFIYAPEEQRIATVMQRDKIGQKEAHEQVHRSDHDRASYIKTFYHCSWQDPLRYHLLINTGQFKVDQAVELIVQANQLRSA